MNQQPLDQQPRISVVLYSGEHSMLGEILTALADQDAAPGDYEVVVADYDQRTDWASYVVDFARAAPHLNLQFHQIANGTRPKAINLAVLNARADLLVLLGDDFVPCREFVSAHLSFHDEHPQAEMVGIGPAFYAAHWRECAFRRWLEDSGTLFGVSFTQPDGILPKHFFYAANTSLKKSFFARAGNFDENFPRAVWDDYEMGLRLLKLGMEAQLVPEASARHEHDMRLAERCDAMRDAGAAAVLLESKYPGAQPWQAQCRKAPWQYRAQSAAHNLKFKLTRAPADLETFYEKILTAHFVEAYRTAKKA